MGVLDQFVDGTSLGHSLIKLFHCICVCICICDSIPRYSFTMSNKPLTEGNTKVICSRLDMKLQYLS